MKSIVVTQWCFHAHFKTHWSPFQIKLSIGLIRTLHRMVWFWTKNILVPQMCISPTIFMFWQSPGKSRRKAVGELVISICAIQWILWLDLDMYPYKMSRAHTAPTNTHEQHQRLWFTAWLKEEHVLFLDEVHFLLDRAVNKQNSCLTCEKSTSVHQESASCIQYHSVGTVSSWELIVLFFSGWILNSAQLLSMLHNSLMPQLIATRLLINIQQFIHGHTTCIKHYLGLLPWYFWSMCDFDSYPGYLTCKPVNALKVNQHFRGTYCLNLQGQRITEARSQLEAIMNISPQLTASWWFLAWLILRPWRWKHYLPLKCLLTFNRIHCVIAQKIELFTVSKILQHRQKEKTEQDWTRSHCYTKLCKCVQMYFNSKWSITIKVNIVSYWLRNTVTGKFTNAVLEASDEFEFLLHLSYREFNNLALFHWTRNTCRMSFCFLWTGCSSGS
jgi:hypothetical protein